MAIDYGELRWVELYRADRWRWAVCTTTGIFDGYLTDTPADVGFPVASQRMEVLLAERWEQSLPWPWLATRDGWWRAAPPSSI